MANSNGIDITLDWEDILLRLEAFARSFANRKHWFRGEHPQAFLYGKEAKDYVDEAILHYLEAPHKFDPQKGALIDYLKYNLIRSLVNIDCNKKENRTAVDINLFSQHFDDDPNDTGSYLDSISPYVEALFADEIDYPGIKNYIETEIRGDAVVENIFLGLFMLMMPRREIIAEFDLTSDEYDNGKRRLETILNRAKIYFSANKKAV
jgi:hypothetical protein